MILTNYFNQNDLWDQMTSLRREMNRLFDHYDYGTQRSFPAVNILANADSAEITAELSGLESKDIKLSLVDQQIILEGQRKQRELKEGEIYHRQERRFGEFKRAIQLPFPVDPESIEANFKDGVLTISLHRAEEDKPKKIEIK